MVGLPTAGCVSVRRIAAELIPRYAIFCPTALEAAARTTLQLSDWSCGILRKGGKEGEGLAGETAEACFYGLVTIATAAATSAFELSSLSATCTEVCRNIYLYLLRQLDGRDLFHQYNFNGKEEEADAKQGENSKGDDVDTIVDSLDPERLGALIASSILQIFTCDPQGVLSVCFELLRSTDVYLRRDGQHFLAQILKSENPAHPEMLESKNIKNIGDSSEGDDHRQKKMEVAPRVDVNTLTQAQDEEAIDVPFSLVARVSHQFF